MKEITKKQLVVRNIAIVFLAIMLVLTLFANTIQNYSLPQVTTYNVSAAVLTHSISQSGTVEASLSGAVYAKGSGHVKTIFISTGKEVAKGDPLFEVEYSNEEDLKNLEDECRQAQMEYDLKELRKSTFNYTEDELAIALAQNELNVATARMNQAAARGESILEYQGEVFRLTYELQSKQNALERKKEADTVTSSVEEKELGFMKAELDEIIRKRDELREMTGTETISATQDGVIAGIYVKQGEEVQKDELLGVLYSQDDLFEMTIMVTKKEADALSETSKISFSGSNRIKGEILSVNDDPEDKEMRVVKIGIHGSDPYEVYPGAVLTVFIEITSNRYDEVVPENCVHKDADGYFVYELIGKSSPLGTRYRVRKHPVQVTDNCDGMCAISGAEEISIVETSNATLKDGDSVRLVY